MVSLHLYHMALSIFRNSKILITLPFRSVSLTEKSFFSCKRQALRQSQRIEKVCNEWNVKISEFYFYDNNVLPVLCIEEQQKRKQLRLSTFILSFPRTKISSLSTIAQTSFAKCFVSNFRVCSYSVKHFSMPRH